MRLPFSLSACVQAVTPRLLNVRVFSGVDSVLAALRFREANRSCAASALPTGPWRRGYTLN